MPKIQCSSLRQAAIVLKALADAAIHASDLRMAEIKDFWAQHKHVTWARDLMTMVAQEQLRVRHAIGKTDKDPMRQLQHAAAARAPRNRD